MNLRLIDVFLPTEKALQVPDLLQDHSVVEIWTSPLPQEKSLIKILVDVKAAESVIDLLDTCFSQVEGFRIILLTVEASVPTPQSAKPDSKEQQSSSELKPQTARISRQELYEKIASTVTLDWHHVLMVFLSTLIASIGLLRDSSTIIIGAMVIAPLLGPNMALALATTLGDLKLGLKALKIGAVGIAIALSISVLIGYLFTVNPDTPEIAFRSRVERSDVILALASGMAGALSFTSGVTNAIVGVMVAVALLPPLVTFGLLLGSGYWQETVGSLLLLVANLACLNLAGIVTFFVQEIRPGKWWETRKAKQVTLTAFLLWSTLISILLVGIWIWHKSYPL